MQVMDYHEAVFASDLTAPQKILALAISKHYNWKNHKVAFPSNRTLVSETSLALSTIVKAKKVLVERGFITSQQRFNNSSEYGCAIPEQLVLSQIAPNNEVNNELNNVIHVSDETSTFTPLSVERVRELEKTMEW